ncbi:MazG-like pyrophosphatase [Serratia phage 92A1]|nr:MazG-like pyrophosphatase [Serratia phage 92A1]
MLDINEVLRVSEFAPIRSVEQVMLNLVEEVGELSVCVNRPYKATEPLIGEAADVINCVIDIVWLDYIHSAKADGLSYAQVREKMTDELNAQLRKKCAKWEQQIS